ncbi:MAG: hypothetical protein V9E87_05340 [Gemmatimonadales bacterium]
MKVCAPVRVGANSELAAAAVVTISCSVTAWRPIVKSARAVCERSTRIPSRACGPKPIAVTATR